MSSELVQVNEQHGVGSAATQATLTDPGQNGEIDAGKNADAIIDLDANTAYTLAQVQYPGQLLTIRANGNPASRVITPPGSALQTDGSKLNSLTLAATESAVLRATRGLQGLLAWRVEVTDGAEA